MNQLEIIGLTLSLGRRRLVENLSFTVRPGEVTTLMGPSGCGKSTVLAWMTGTLAPAFVARGELRLAGRSLLDLPTNKRSIGIQFQDDLLFSHLSVGQNLQFGLKAGAPRGRVDAALNDAGLAGFADRDPATLSGGQRARVALLRTLLSDPQALLLDEPFNRLDAQLRDEFRRFVFTQARQANLPVVMVTHDLVDAQAAGGAVIELGEAGRTITPPMDNHV